MGITGMLLISQMYSESTLGIRRRGLSGIRISNSTRRLSFLDPGKTAEEHPIIRGGPFEGQSFWRLSASTMLLLISSASKFSDPSGVTRISIS